MQALAEAEPIARLIAAARRQIGQAVALRVRRHGLNPQRFWLLINIRETPGLSLRELARRLRADEPTASRIVAGLKRRRLVQVRSDPRDRRRHCLELTDRGAALADAVAPIAAEVRMGVEAGLGPEEKDTLRRLLTRVIESARRLDQESET
jgi:DNA-binding MarR family transcriptional regulator